MYSSVLSLHLFIQPLACLHIPSLSHSAATLSHCSFTAISNSTCTLQTKHNSESMVITGSSIWPCCEKKLCTGSEQKSHCSSRYLSLLSQAQPCPKPCPKPCAHQLLITEQEWWGATTGKGLHSPSIVQEKDHTTAGVVSMVKKTWAQTRTEKGISDTLLSHTKTSATLYIPTPRKQLWIVQSTTVTVWPISRPV